MTEEQRDEVAQRVEEALAEFRSVVEERCASVTDKLIEALTPIDPAADPYGTEYLQSLWSGDDEMYHDLIPDDVRRSVIALPMKVRGSIRTALFMAYTQGFEDGADVHGVGGFGDEQGTAYADRHFGWLAESEAAERGAMA